MAITVSATKPRPVPGRLNLAYTYWRQRSAYVRLIKWIKLLCTRDRSVNVEVHEMIQMRWVDVLVQLENRVYAELIPI